MQDRLIKELRLAGISSIDAANEYLKTSNFIDSHNSKFAERKARNRRQSAQIDDKRIDHRLLHSPGEL